MQVAFRLVQAPMDVQEPVQVLLQWLLQVVEHAPSDLGQDANFGCMVFHPGHKFGSNIHVQAEIRTGRGGEIQRDVDVGTRLVWEDGEAGGAVS